MRDRFSAFIGIGVGALLMSTVFISSCTIMTIGIIVMSLLAGGGTFMLMGSMEKPPAPNLSIVMDNTAVVGDAVRNIGTLMEKTQSEIASQERSGKTVYSGDNPLKNFRDMLSSMNALMIMPEFLKSSNDDRTLMCSLSSSFLPDTFDNIMNNTRYLSFSGSARDKAIDNLAEICKQISYVDGSIMKIQESIVNNQSMDVAVGTEYLKARISNDDKSMLTIENLGGNGKES